MYCLCERTDSVTKLSETVHEKQNRERETEKEDASMNKEEPKSFITIFIIADNPSALLPYLRG